MFRRNLNSHFHLNIYQVRSDFFKQSISNIAYCGRMLWVDCILCKAVQSECVVYEILLVSLKNAIHA